MEIPYEAFWTVALKIIHENILNILSLKNQKTELEYEPNINLVTEN